LLARTGKHVGFGLAVLRDATIDKDEPFVQVDAVAPEIQEFPFAHSEVIRDDEDRLHRFLQGV
jgi:hypothetical protein